MTWDRLFSFVTTTLSKWELKTVSWSRIAPGNLVNNDVATVYSNDENRDIDIRWATLGTLSDDTVDVSHVKMVFCLFQCLDSTNS